MNTWFGRVVRRSKLPWRKLSRFWPLGLALSLGFVSSVFGQEADPVVKTTHPAGGIHSANLPLSIGLIFGHQNVPRNAIELWLDGQDATPATQFKGSPLTWQLVLEMNLTRQAEHSYEVRVHYTNRADFIFSAKFFTDVRGSGDFLIEAEDFNYSQGRFKAQASLPAYAGAAYEGLGAVHGVDYYQANPTNEIITDPYRNREELQVTILYSDHLERSGYDLDRNWIVAAGPQDWFNYTRTFPPGYYQVYAALSGTPGAGKLEGMLSRISNAQTANQTVGEMGVFEGGSGEGWGENRLLPLLDQDTKVRKLVYFEGTETVRYSPVQGALDYLTLVPELPLTLTALSRNLIRLNWTGTGRLEEASDPSGPWQENSQVLSPPLELVLPEGASRGFFRLKLSPAATSPRSAVPRTP